MDKCQFKKKKAPVAPLVAGCGFHSPKEGTRAPWDMAVSRIGEGVQMSLPDL